MESIFEAKILADAKKEKQILSEKMDVLQKKEREEAISEEEKAELIGLRAFPHNPRAAGLRKKEVLKTISKEEQAELWGWNMFPDNPEMAELRKKEALGILKEGEKKKYLEFLKGKRRENAFSYEIQQLLEKAEKGDPSVELVSMNDGKVIKVKPEDVDGKTILTTGLGGCYGTLVFTEHENGIRTAMLTHYDPTLLVENIGKYESLARANPIMAESRTKKAVYVMVSDRESPKSVGNEQDRFLSQQGKDALELALKAELGSDVEIKIISYSTLREFGEIDRGVLCLKLPPVSKGEPRYKTWFCEGGF